MTKYPADIDTTVSPNSLGGHDQRCKNNDKTTLYKSEHEVWWDVGSVSFVLTLVKFITGFSQETIRIHED
jgi:hypothetical protein